MAQTLAHGNSKAKTELYTQTPAATMECIKGKVRASSQPQTVYDELMLELIKITCRR